MNRKRIEEVFTDKYGSIILDTVDEEEDPEQWQSFTKWVRDHHIEMSLYSKKGQRGRPEWPEYKYTGCLSDLNQMMIERFDMDDPDWRSEFIDSFVPIGKK